MRTAAAIPKLVLLSLALTLVFQPPDLSAQSLEPVFTSFDSVLGAFHPNELIDPRYGLSQELAESLVTASAVLQAAAAREIANLSISVAGTQYFFGKDRMFYLSENLGTYFIEPPWTTGEGNGSIGINTAHFNFRELNGQDLEDIFDFYDAAGVQRWEGDYGLKGQLTSVSLTYGVTDRLDLGVIFPLVHLEGDGRAQLLGIAGLPPLAGFHESVTDLADVFLRAKYELIEVEDLDDLFSWTAGIDFKLDNGNQDKLLGTGDVGYRLRTAMGKRFGPIYPVIEVGYNFAGVDVRETATVMNNLTGLPQTLDTGLEDDDFDAFELRCGVPLTVLEERLTLSVEWMLSVSDFMTTNDIGVATRFKINDQLFVQGGVRLPLDDNGLRADFVPVFGGEFRF